MRGYSSRLRQHIERETHYLFPLVEEQDTLARFGNWDEEHVSEQSAAVRRPTSG